MLTKLLRLIAYLVPCDTRTQTEMEVGRGEAPNPDPPDDGTVPIGGPPPDGSSPAPTPTEGTPPATGAQGDLDLAAKLEAANTRIAEIEARDVEREGRIDALAEERLLQAIPGLPDTLEQERIRREQAQETQPGEPVDPVEETIEARMDRLENQQVSDRRNVDATNIYNEVEGYRGKYPHMDPTKVLMTLARGENRELNVEKLCEFSHRTQMGRMEQYHQARLQDTEYMKSIVANAQRQGIGAAGPTPPPALGHPESQGAPAPGTSPEPITRSNATQRFQEGLARIWNKKEVGPPPNK